MQPVQHHRIDCLQYANWSEKIFQQMRQGQLNAVHATIAYHENFRQTVEHIKAWNQTFCQHANLVFLGQTAEDVRRAHRERRTAIFLGAQNCSPIEDDLSLIKICHTLGLRFMQLSYNNQSLLASGYLEKNDSGITRFGRQAITEMNRVGLVIDMSHSSERSTLEAIEISERAIAITHANPALWHQSARNKSEAVLSALAKNGGVMGFSLYPHHLKHASQCQLKNFCQMIAETVNRHGIESFGIGSDLCQDQPDDVLAWMRDGKWRLPKAKQKNDEKPKFPEQPDWFQDNRDFPNLEKGLTEVGFNPREVAALLGENWLRFFETAFTPVPTPKETTPHAQIK